MILGPEESHRSQLDWKERSELQDPGQYGHHENEDLDTDPDSENESTELQSLAPGLKEFIVSGKAFRNMRRNFSEFVNPPKTQRPLEGKQNPPERDDEFTRQSQADPPGEKESWIHDTGLLDHRGSAPSTGLLSLTCTTSLLDGLRIVHFTPWTLVPGPRIIDQAKKKVEMALSCPVVWWPLQPIKNECLKDYVRLHWTCGCGTDIHADISIDAANQYAKRCTPRTLSPSNPPILPVHNPGPSNSNSASTLASASGVSAQVRNAHPHLNITQRPNPSQASIPSHVPSTQHPRQADIGADAGSNGFLHCCVDANISDTHLFHIPVPSVPNHSVISELKATFNTAKGLRKWISLTDCHDVKFMKFERLSIQHSHELIACGQEALPPVRDQEYTYNYEDPLEQFTESLRKSMLHLMHNSSCCFPEDIKEFLDRIPKKVNAKLEIKRRAKGYGILAIPGISLWKLMLALALWHTGPLIFLVRWLHSHPGDLQNGLQLWFYLMTLLSLLVAIPDVSSLWSLKRDKNK